jgi:P27 family predicted phage terminase small subunit
MKRGVKPMPTVLKDLHGTARLDRFNPDEPKPEGDLDENPTDCPEHFTPEMRAIWEYALQHAPPGLLKRLDASVLEIWVVAHSIHRTATKMLRGLLIRTPNSDYPVQSPILPVINRQAMVMIKAAEQLGFTPTARPRIVATTGGAQGENLQRRGAASTDESLDSYLANAPRAIH